MQITHTVPLCDDKKCKHPTHEADLKDFDPEILLTLNLDESEIVLEALKQLKSVGDIVEDEVKKMIFLQLAKTIKIIRKKYGKK